MTRFFGDLSQSEKLSEIKPPLKAPFPGIKKREGKYNFVSIVTIRYPRKRWSYEAEYGFLRIDNRVDN